MKAILAAGVAAIAVLFGGVGCQDTVNTVENADKNMTPRAIKDARFVTDGFLADRLVLTKVETAESPLGFMVVQLTAYNARTGFWSEMWSGMTGENPYEISYRFTWFDANGMAVEDTLSNSWKTISIIPGETVQIQAVAPRKNCRDFLVNLKEAN